MDVRRNGSETSVTGPVQDSAHRVIAILTAATKAQGSAHTAAKGVTMVTSAARSAVATVFGMFVTSGRQNVHKGAIITIMDRNVNIAAVRIVQIFSVLDGTGGAVFVTRTTEVV